MQISGNTRVFTILGDPVAQVRAPQLFNRLFARHGVDAVLVPAAVPAAEVATYVRGFFLARNAGGLWVTIPHKAALLPLLAHCDARGLLAQAVNAVRRREDGSLEGALFDGEGFAKSLDHFDVPCAGKRVLVVGVGGAGTAIAVSLAERGVSQLSLFGPERKAVEAVAARIRRAYPQTPIHVAASADPQGHDLVVNATPLGLEPNDPLPFDPRRLSPGSAVVDILMKNQPTPLLQACAAQGARVYTGFEMMVQQASSYLHFFGLHDLARLIDNDTAEVRQLIEQN